MGTLRWLPVSLPSWFSVQCRISQLSVRPVMITGTGRGTWSRRGQQTRGGQIDAGRTSAAASTGTGAGALQLTLWDLISRAELFQRQLLPVHAVDAVVEGGLRRRGAGLCGLLGHVGRGGAP